jgi:putative ABC transport system substrate-binding protein
VTRHFLRSLLVAVFCVLWAGAAWCANVVVVASDSGVGYTMAAEAFNAELARGTAGSVRPTVTLMSVAQWEAAEALSIVGSKLVVALGSAALRQVLAKRHAAPILAALIPRSGVEHVLKGQVEGAGLVTAVYLDQPLARQVELLRLALPNAQRVGVIWGPESIVRRPSLSAILRAQNLQEVAGIVAEGEPLQLALKTVLTNSEVLLAMADPNVFNATTVSNILLATYRAGIPVMAFSPAYVRAGALLALYSTPEQVGQQAGALARTILLGGSVPVAQYPFDYSVEVNENVARSLGLRLDQATLLRQLRQLERHP